MNIELYAGDNMESLKLLPDNSVDSVVTDPPYGISFMAKKWDYDVPSAGLWREVLRVLKPGGHALIACGTRTQHRMVVNIEDAGFEIRDVVSWIYGSGFPKSLNISKAIDKSAGAKQWDGWGTALKPSCEFFTLCRKPLSEKTIVANVLEWGTGGINVDGCRVKAPDKIEPTTRNTSTCGEGWKRPWMDDKEKDATRQAIAIEKANTMGRFPANLIHDGSQEVHGLFPETGGKSPARFFYCAKASKKDRDEGNAHPTVKPTALMAY